MLPSRTFFKMIVMDIFPFSETRTPRGSVPARPDPGPGAAPLLPQPQRPAPSPPVPGVPHHQQHGRRLPHRHQRVQAHRRRRQRGRQRRQQPLQRRQQPRRHPDAVVRRRPHGQGPEGGGAAVSREMHHVPLQVPAARGYGRGHSLQSSSLSGNKIVSQKFS